MNYQTDRLVIRPFQQQDQEPMIDLFMDPVVKQTYMLPDYASRQEAAGLFQRLMTLSHQEGSCVAALCLQAKCVGLINETEVDGSSIELGYALLPEFHGRGLATEALTGAIRYLFAEGFTRVVCGAFEENTASIRVMEKAGMVRLDKEDEISYRGKTHRCIYYCAEK